MFMLRHDGEVIGKPFTQYMDLTFGILGWRLPQPEGLMKLERTTSHYPLLEPLRHWASWLLLQRVSFVVNDYSEWLHCHHPRCKWPWPSTIQKAPLIEAHSKGYILMFRVQIFKAKIFSKKFRKIKQKLVLLWHSIPPKRVVYSLGIWTMVIAEILFTRKVIMFCMYPRRDNARMTASWWHISQIVDFSFIILAERPYFPLVLGREDRSSLPRFWVECVWFPPPLSGSDSEMHTDKSCHGAKRSDVPNLNVCMLNSFAGRTV